MKNAMIEKPRDITLMIFVGTMIALILSHVLTFWVLPIAMTPLLVLATIVSPIVIASMMLGVLGRSMLSETNLRLQLQTALEKDHLTDIFNRKYFFDRIARMPDGTKAAILMVDVDFFKKINDTYGHFAGDAVIRHVAQTLAHSVRQTDFVARFGGEEFVAFLHGGDLSGAAQLAERFRGAVELAVIDTDCGPVSVTVSIGLSTSDAQQSLEQAVKNADDALLVAKQTGRNRVEISHLQLDGKAA